MQQAEHAIVVFGAAVDSDGLPRPLLLARLRRALLLAREDPAAVVLVSGGVVRGRPAEGPAMKRWLLLQGLDPDRIVLEPNARTTIENAALVAPLLGQLGVRRATLVTQRCHLPRAVLDTYVALRRARLRRVSLAVAAADDPRAGFAGAVSSIAEGFKLGSDLLLSIFPGLRRWLPRADASADASHRA